MHVNENNTASRDKETNLDRIKESAIKHATGKAGSKFNSIDGEGFSNHVWRVTTPEGEELILRIGRNPRSRGQFVGERTAINKCAKVEGLPVPKVVALNSYEDGGEILYTSVETSMPGVSMKKYIEEHPEARLDLAWQAGAMLKKLNSARVEYFGPLDRRLHGHKESVHELLNNESFNLQSLLKIAPQLEIEPEIILKVYDRYDLLRAKFRNVEPCLVHNDFNPKNILVVNGKISAIIDFEYAGGGDPVHAFAHWRLCTEDKESTEALISGYYGGKPDDPDFALKMETWNTQIVLGILQDFLNKENMKGILECYKKLFFEIADNLP
jgi:aminoglycoside phosphotransferase (APT) family kinase protein